MSDVVKHIAHICFYGKINAFLLIAKMTNKTQLLDT